MPISYDNLLREGRNSENIYVTGNTVIDAMQHTVKEGYTYLKLDWVGDGKLIFITAYRLENLGKIMHQLFPEFRRNLDVHPECKAVYTIYMYPVVREAVETELRGCDQLHNIEPIEVFDCHNYTVRSFLCLTDSGGIQEKSPSYDVPVLFMRDTTECPEGVKEETLKLVDTDEETIYRIFKELLENHDEYANMSYVCNF